MISTEMNKKAKLNCNSKLNKIGRHLEWMLNGNSFIYLWCVAVLIDYEPFFSKYINSIYAKAILFK